MSAGLKFESWLWEVCFSQYHKPLLYSKKKKKELDIGVMKASYNFNEKTDVENPK